MTNEQLKQLTREDLDNLQQSVLAEQTRRDTLTTTVDRVKELGDTYESLGGNKSELVSVLQES